MIESALFSQLYIFMVFFGVSMLAGLVFDLYRVLRTLRRPAAGVTLMADLFFWFLATVATGLVLLSVNWGELRSYVFWGLIVGALFYYRFFSRRTICFWKTLINFFVILLRKCLK